MKKTCKVSRREFFRTGSAVGVGALLNPLTAGARPRDGEPAPLTAAAPLRVPTRPFGKTGAEVSILSLGGMFDIVGNQLILKQALRWGVTYWDTADCYQNGESERGVGKYFAKYPEDREKVFLVTKSDARDPKGMTDLLNRSLERMNTSHVDLYFIHGVSGLDELSDETRRWVDKAKAAGKIKLFGFSTHSNMEMLLAAAPGLGYIDGIMMTYNFRNMFSAEMKAAVAACVRAGIGLTAMKTQAGRSWMKLSKADKSGSQLIESFIGKGFTKHQAKLKAVWANSNIACICSQMPNMTIMKANVQAAADNTPLTTGELRLFERHARETASQYCGGCQNICSTAVHNRVPIGDIMRYHMYSQNYGQLDWARAHFQALPDSVRRDMARLDFTDAQRSCPRGMPIARLMRRALRDFA